jgi:hypothetical protein
MLHRPSGDPQQLFWSLGKEAVEIRLGLTVNPPSRLRRAVERSKTPGRPQVAIQIEGNEKKLLREVVERASCDYQQNT